MTPFLPPTAAHGSSNKTDRGREFRGSLHLILSHLIIPAFAILLIAGGTNVSARELAQQREGAVLQQLERDRRDQELQQREKQQKKPPVIIREDRKESADSKPGTDEYREKNEQK
jgi:hypothetical protein